MKTFVSLLLLIDASSAALKELRIALRTPSPVPLEERPEEDLNPQELLELVRQLKVSSSVLLRGIEVTNYFQGARGYCKEVKPEPTVANRLKREHVEDNDVTVVSTKRLDYGRKPPSKGYEVIELD